MGGESLQWGIPYLHDQQPAALPARQYGDVTGRDPLDDVPRRLCGPPHKERWGPVGGPCGLGGGRVDDVVYAAGGDGSRCVEDLPLFLLGWIPLAVPEQRNAAVDTFCRRNVWWAPFGGCEWDGETTAWGTVPHLVPYATNVSHQDLPTDIYHATSTDLIQWTVTPRTPVFSHAGQGFEHDQAAGPVPVEGIPGSPAHLYYDGDNNVVGSCAIGMAIAT